MPAKKSHPDDWRAEIREIRQILKDTAEEGKKTRAEIRAIAAEHKKTEAAIRAIADDRKKTEAAIRAIADDHKKFQAEREAGRKQREQEMKILHKTLGGIGNTQGDIAEDLFRRNFIPAMRESGIALDECISPLGKTDRRDDGREYDIVGLNGDAAVVAEVKAQLRKSDVKWLLGKLPEFRRHFPVFGRKNLYGAVAGLSVKKEVEKFAEDCGLFVLTQTQSGGVSLHKPAKGFKPRKF
jgi:hypothetical protein